MTLTDLPVVLFTQVQEYLTLRELRACMGVSSYFTNITHVKTTLEIRKLIDIPPPGVDLSTVEELRLIGDQDFELIPEKLWEELGILLVRLKDNIRNLTLIYSGTLLKT